VDEPAGPVLPGGPEPAEGQVSIPLFARVHLAHAIVQRIAEDAGVSLLHIKGPALIPGLRPEGRQSSDVDVLVRPGQFRTLERALQRHGWESYSGVETGSAFEHAANWWHPHWGYADLHETWPGPTVSPDETWAALSEKGFDHEIAHVPCPVPGRTAQILVLLLHAARSHSDRDLELPWHTQTEEQRRAVLALADRLGAQVALAAALGDLESHRDDRTYALWRYYREGGGRLDEWRARYRAAATTGDRLRVITSATRVNRDHLRMRLGHPPTAADVRREQVERVRKLVGEAGRLILRRDRRRGT
jgi:Uncharacterised nucleotidyltransferase